ncbi:hypothetical protein C8R45DRAFT_1217177 [Mycena sanguinolenta]|nr:hypothetical protein C8R45DRAFT_1217177 [Mycena sanguinolenta]
MPPVRREEPRKSGKSGKRPPSIRLKFACSFSRCGWSHSRKSELSRHSLTHLPEAERREISHYCNHPRCGYFTLQLSNLITHQRTHSGDKCKACTECDYKSTDPSSITNHRKRWHGYVPTRNAKSQRVARATAQVLVGDAAHATWQVTSPASESLAAVPSSSSSSPMASPHSGFSDFSAQSWVTASSSSSASPRSVFADFSTQSWGDYPSASASPDPSRFASSPPCDYAYPPSTAASASSFGHPPTVSSSSGYPYAASSASPSLDPSYDASPSSSCYASVLSGAPCSSFGPAHFTSPPASFPGNAWAGSARAYTAHSNRYTPYPCSHTTSSTDMTFPLPSNAYPGLTPLRLATSFDMEMDTVLATVSDDLVAKAAAAAAARTASAPSSRPVARYDTFELAASIPPAYRR